MPAEFAEPTQAAGGKAVLQPGPVAPGAVPDPTEIVCIEVEKVFDYCFQEVIAQRSVPAPAVRLGTPISCHLNTEAASCHVLGSHPGPDELRTINMTVTVPGAVQVGDGTTVPITFVVFKSMQLYAPEGTHIQCGVTGTCLADLIDHNGDGVADELGCQANLCVVIQSKAAVKLLVPAYGLCVPGPIRETPVHPMSP